MGTGFKSIERKKVGDFGLTSLHLIKMDDQDSPPENMRIFIYHPGEWMLKVNVLKSTFVKDLNQIVLGDPVYFVYNGCIMMNNFDLGSYNVKENDFIIVVDQRSLPSNLKFDNIHMPKIHECVELAKLQDMQFQKMERKPKTFRQFLHSFQSATETTTFPQIPINIPIKLPSPASEPLPKFWAQPSVRRTTNLISPDTPLAALCQGQAGNADAAFP